MGLRTHIRNYWHYMAAGGDTSALHARRGGACKLCGKCCNPLFLPFGIKLRCPFLDPVTSRCRIYRSWFRPIICKLSPTFMNEEEVERHREMDCGFYPIKPPDSKNQGGGG
jgi:hypothetical protein